MIIKLKFRSKITVLDLVQIDNLFQQFQLIQNNLEGSKIVLEV